MMKLFSPENGSAAWFKQRGKFDKETAAKIAARAKERQAYAYRIISSSEVKWLEDSVNSLLAEGYYPIGGIQHIDQRFIQAVFRESIK